MPVVPGNPPSRAAGRAARTGVVAAAALLGALGGCGEGEPTTVPIAAVPLGAPGGQCVDVFQSHLEGADAKVCLYFEGSACVLVADLGSASTDGCATDGACSLEQSSWMKYCPEGAPGYDLETEAGQRVPASVFVVADGLPGERPSYCTFDAPTAACDGSSDPAEGTTGCLARIDVTYVVDEVDGSLAPDPDVAPTLSYSGFVQEEMGLWSSDEPICPTIEAASCPPAAASCTPVDLELLLQGSATGQVRAVPRGDVCLDPRCTSSYPRGRTVSVSATADPGAVVTELAAALGAEGGCNELFTETTTTATCSVDLTGSGQVTVKFGYELTVGVNGLGQVTGSPGGVDGDGIDCAGNQTCREIYDEDAMVTLTASETEVDWQFSQWMGGPCDGDQAATCTVRMAQAHTVSALFGYALTLQVEGDGVVTATPPGFACEEPPCVLTYGSGDTTTLTVTPGARSVFAGWGGACASEGSNPVCTIELDAEKTVIARFDYEVESRREGGGNISRDPPGGACSALSSDVCGTYAGGTNVTFTGAASQDWVFLEWSGCTAPDGQPQCTLPVQAHSVVRASFGRQLDVTVAGQGTVGFSETGSHGTCGSSSSTDCYAAYSDGATVTLSASPAPGWAVQAESWSGCTPVNGDPTRCTVVMSGPRQVGLVFGRQLDVTVTGSGQISSTPAGIDCGADCVEVFADGTSVTLTAVPVGGWSFQGWTGCNPRTNPRVCSVSMDAARAVTASFGRELDVQVVGGGVVQSTPAGIACADTGGDCSEIFTDGTSVVLDAIPNASWAFLGWGPGCTPDPVISTRCTASLSAARSITATFGRQLIVSTTGTGSVDTVGSSGISCPGDCDEVFSDNLSVTLRATPGAGWALVGFSGCDTVNGSDCTVSMNQARNVSATFGRNLDVTVNGGGTVVGTGINCTDAGGDCTEVYGSGTSVTLDASPSNGWGFLGWQNCVQDAVIPTRCTVTMSAARSVIANFGRPLEVAVVGNGSVSSSPAGINCGADCTEVFANGTSVTLTATPVAPAQFGGWTGCPAANGNQCTATMNTARTVTASFGAGVTVLIADGAGTVQSTPTGISCPGDCNEVFQNNQNVTLVATPSSGYVVRDWAGCAQDANNPNRCTLTATGGGQGVTVRFGRQLQVNVQGGGTVTSNPGINCGTDCDEVLSNGDAVTLVGTPDAGWTFMSWSGCTPVPGTPEQCTTTMTQARSVSATFGRQLDVVISGSGTTSSSPSGVACGANCEVHLDGQSVLITATPAGGWAVQGWSGCTPQANPAQCVVTMSGAQTVNVTFGRRLDVTVNGNGTVASLPAGIDCGADCSEVFGDGQAVTLTAAPDAGHDLGSWSGCTPVGGNPLQCTTTMSAARAVTATFNPNLTVNAPSAITGESVVSNPAGISCVGPACSDTASFATGSTVRLIATPATGRVVSWSGCTVVPTDPNQCDRSLSVPRTVTVTFSPTLTVNAPSALAGESVTSNPAGIDCVGPACSDTAAFPANTSVVLTAVPATGRAVRWSGCTVGGNPNQCTVTMNAPSAVTATFEPTLTVNGLGSEAGEGVTSNPAGINCFGANCTDTAAFAVNTAVRLTATPGVNRAVSWSGCAPVGGSPNECDVTVSSPQTVDVTFLDIFALDITIDTSSTSGGAAILSPASVEGTTTCNVDCTVTYVEGTSVDITDQPDPGSNFINFQGDCNGGSCTVLMDQARAVTLRFN